MEDLPVRGGARQCRTTLVQQLDAGGFIPKWVVDKTAPRALKAVQDVIDEFRQDDRIDAADREELLALMEGRCRKEVYSEEENALLQRVRQKFEGSWEESKWKHLKVRSCEERKQGMRQWSARSEASRNMLPLFVADVMSVESSSELLLLWILIVASPVASV